MSKYLKPCLYSKKGLEQQWMNTIYNSHDLFCGCNQPFEHFKDIQKRDKWLHTKDVGTTTEDPTENGDDFDINEGDLDQLFAAENAATG